jgi:hypothetical protein
MRSFDKVKGKVTVVCCIFNKNIAYAGSSEGRITKFDISTGRTFIIYTKLIAEFTNFEGSSNFKRQFSVLL